MSIPSPIGSVLKVFYSYAQRDKKFQQDLEKHLSSLQRQGLISGWHVGEIEAGSERDLLLKEHLHLSDIILLLISADFIASENCYCSEMSEALRKHERGEAYVIPILLRPTHTQGLPFAFLRFLPMDGKPITRWRDKDAAFARITEAIRHVIQEICTRLPSESAPSKKTGSSPASWKVPYPRNSFFTGRDTILEQLFSTFFARKTGIVMQSVNGLAGIGKTQIALEYVYRYAPSYQAIFWVAADSQGDLLTDFVSIAQFLKAELELSEKNEADQARIVAAVKEWFHQHEGWLLVLDNVEDVAALTALIPTTGQGHILITTRARATGDLVTSREIEAMDVEEGTRLLLQRAKLLSPEGLLEQVESQDKTAAEEIVRLFAGHPLALDQAGAYVEETGRHLADYLDVYHQRQAALLQRRGKTRSDHQDSVLATFSLAFENVERLRPDAAELLRFCAFLHPDALPEELLMAGAQSFDQAYQHIAHDPFELDATLEVLLTYSLVKRNPATKTLSVHRLVQDVLKYSMDEEQQRHWAERVVRTLSRQFPDGEPDSWLTCQRYLPQARVGIQLLKAWQMHFIEAVYLLKRVGYYLFKRAEYADAQICFEQALALLTEDEEPLLTAQILGHLGVIDIFLAQYSEAEHSLKRALAVRERFLEPAHPELAQNLNDLAGVYHNQGRLTEAEPFYQRALAIQEQALGAEDPMTVRTLGNLALLKYSLKKYAEAEALNLRVLAIRERQLGPEHVDSAQSRLNLAYVYYRQQRYAEAEPLFRHALASYEEAYGPENPQTANVLNGLGLLYTAQKRYDEAEPLLQRARTIMEKAYGPVHPRFIGLLHALAIIALSQKQPEEAEELLRRAQQIQEQRSWLEHTNLVPSIKELTLFYESQGKQQQAESLNQLIAVIRQRFPEDAP